MRRFSRETRKFFCFFRGGETTPSAARPQKRARGTSPYIGLPQKSCEAKDLWEKGEKALSWQSHGVALTAFELGNGALYAPFPDRARALPREKSRRKWRGDDGRHPPHYAPCGDAVTPSAPSGHLPRRGRQGGCKERGHASTTTLPSGSFLAFHRLARWKPRGTKFLTTLPPRFARHPPLHREGKG